MSKIKAESTSLANRIANRTRGVSRLSPTATAGVLVILFFGVLAMFSGGFMTHDPVSSYPDRILEAPSAEHWFGTDGNGMDVFSRVIYGAKFGFGVAIPAVIISVLIGVPVGLIAGYRGGF